MAPLRHGAPHVPLGRGNPLGADACCAGTDCRLLPTTEATELATVLKALADPTRVRLVQYLACAPESTVCACHLAPALGISQPTLSFHMKKLSDAGLVTREKRGRWVHYAVRPSRLTGIRRLVDLLTGSAASC